MPIPSVLPSGLRFRSCQPFRNLAYRCIRFRQEAQRMAEGPARAASKEGAAEAPSLASTGSSGGSGGGSGDAIDLDLVVFVALALDPALALLDLGGKPGNVELVQGLQTTLRIDAGAHGLGRTDQDADLAAVDGGEQSLLGAGLLEVLLDALRKGALIGEEGGARGSGDDLAPPARDLWQAQMLPKVRLQDDVRRHAIDRHEVGDVHEFAKACDRLVEARRLNLEFGPSLPEIGRPGVELLNAPFAKRFRLDELLQREDFAERVSDRRPGGGHERAPGIFLGVEEARLDEQVPGALGAVRIDAFQGSLVGRKREFSKLLHLVDDELIDADLVDRQHVVLARLQPFQIFFEPLLHPLDALARDAVGAVDPLQKVGVGLDLVGISRRSNAAGAETNLKAEWVMMMQSHRAVAARARKRWRFSLTKLVSSATRIRAFG